MKPNQQKTDLAGQIRTSILSGRYLPNERLIETELALVYQTSRANVRNALARLEHERLVIHEANRGARVRAVGPEEAIEIVEVRGALETLNARKAAEHATEADRQKLRRILDDMKFAVENGHFATMNHLNNELHGTIQTISRNETAARFINLLLFPVVRMQYRSILLPGRREESFEEHEAIVISIISGNPDAATAAMRRHFDGLLAALRRAIEYSRVEEASLSGLGGDTVAQDTQP